MKKHLSINIDPELLSKFQYVADYDGDSGNAKLTECIRLFVEETEKKYGPLKEEAPKKKLSYSLYLDEKMMRRFKLAAKRNHRSATGEALRIMSDVVAAYEAEHGEITCQDMD